MTVTVSTDLPISADQAWGLAQKPALLAYVLKPFLSTRGELPERVAEGEELSAKLRFLGVLPGWTHTLRIERLVPGEIVSREGGGPVKRWNHRLTFEPLSERSCRYTDAVDVAAGPFTPLVWLFAAFIYRYRHRRWRTLARVLA